MDSVIRQVDKEDCAALARILAHAYPSPGSTEDSVAKLAQQLRDDLDREGNKPFYGAFRNGELLGAARLLEFTMNFRSAKVRLGGIAGVCVDLLHKKEKVARDLLAYALLHFQSEGIYIASLYPFQTGFYKKMGFGYGTMKHQFRIKPEAFPKGESKRDIFYLTEEDKPDALACYRRCFESETGMLDRQEVDLASLLHFGHIAVGVRQDGEMTGYLVFHFKRVKAEYAQRYDMVVSELIYHTPEALSGLCAFLRSQSDQVHRVVVTTQDEHFWYLFDDPTNGRFDSFETTALESHVTAVGSMYRALDVPLLFAALADCDFGGVTCTLKLTIRDGFIESNGNGITVRFVDGKVAVAEAEPFDAAIELDIAHFSSLLIGAVRFHSLYGYGLAKLSDPSYCDTVDRLFAVRRRPRSDTYF